MTNEQKQKLMKQKKITEDLFDAIRLIYLNVLKVDDLDVARLQHITNELFNERIDKNENIFN